MICYQFLRCVMMHHKILSYPLTSKIVLWLKASLEMEEPSKSTSDFLLKPISQSGKYLESLNNWTNAWWTKYNKNQNWSIHLAKYNMKLKFKETWVKNK